MQMEQTHSSDYNQEEAEESKCANLQNHLEPKCLGQLGSSVQGRDAQQLTNEKEAVGKM